MADIAEADIDCCEGVEGVEIDMVVDMFEKSCSMEFGMKNGGPSRETMIPPSIEKQVGRIVLLSISRNQIEFE